MFANRLVPSKAEEEVARSHSGYAYVRFVKLAVVSNILESRFKGRGFAPADADQAGIFIL